MFNIDIRLILIALLFSGVGFVYFSYGKKQSKMQLMLCGIGLMGYGYFTPTVLTAIVVGIALSALPFVFKWW